MISMDGGADGANIGANVGSEMRQLRKARSLTLKQLSASTGVSLSHLSAIERGSSSPSIDILAKIAQTLGVTLDWFFTRRTGDGPMERRYVVRVRNRRDLNILYGQDPKELGYQDWLLSSSIGGAFYMGMAVYEPHSQTKPMSLHLHDGEQHGIVVEGELEMRIGDEVVTLREGDSYSFSASIPHHGYNKTDQICRLIWAVSPVVIPSRVEVGGTKE